jgi:DNA-directed RNA polymerase specialized sigma24 family protein
MSSHRILDVANAASRDIFLRLSNKRTVFLAFLRKRVDSPEVAEDLLQAAYVRAIEHLAELRDERRAEAWFYQLLRNAIVDHYRRAATAAKVFAGEAGFDRPAEPVRRPNPCPCAMRELSQIRTDYARALENVEMEGTSVRAFASSESITPGAASVRLHRARKVLASRLETVCGACSGEGCFDCTCASSAL